MKRYFFLILILCAPLWAVSQNATATIGHHINAPGTQVVVPIQVTGFSGIGAISLFYFYDNEVVSFSGFQNPAVSGMIVNGFYDSFAGRWKVGITYSDVYSFDIPDGKLIEILFDYAGGTTALEFDLAMSEVSDDDLYNPSSIPIDYTNGSISPMNPEDMTQLLIGHETALHGNPVYVPVTVKNFNDIGAFNLGISFNTGSLSFTGLANYHALIDPSQVVVNQSAGTVFVGWNIAGTPSNGISLAYDQKLFDLAFTFNGGASPLAFDLSQNEVTALVNDEPFEVPVVYTDGSVTGSELLDVTVTLSDVVVAPGQSVSVPVTATGLEKLGAFDFTISYQTGNLVFAGIENLHPQLASTGSLLQNHNDGNVFAAWNYSGTASHGIEIPDNEKLFDLLFTNVSATSPLAFNLLYSEVSQLEDDEILPLAVSYLDGSVTVQEDIVLGLKVMLDGLYNAGAGQMNKAKDYAGGQVVDKYEADTADVIRIELHEAGNYGTPVFAADNVALRQDGTASIVVPGTNSGSYYISIRHRNHLETVSANPVSITGTGVTYDFTTAASQAYGNNQKQLVTGVFGIYAGDVNQDGVINVLDRDIINNAFYGSVAGYVIQDTNGDGFVNVSDRDISNNGFYNSVQAAKPD